jgi:hypothetical protein
MFPSTRTVKGREEAGEEAILEEESEEAANEAMIENIRNAQQFKITELCERGCT